MRTKVLIIEDDADTRRALRLRLQAAGYDAFVAADVALGIQAARRVRPDIILLDLALPGGGGLMLLHRLRQMTALSNVPVVVFSALDPNVYRDCALEAGAVAFLPKPLDNEELLSTLARYSRQAAQERPKVRKILVLEDDADTRQGLCLRLRASGYAVTEAEDSVTAVSVALRETPDLVLLDLGLPAGDGFQFLERISLHPSISTVPVVVLTAHTTEANKERALKAGVAAFLEKPPDNEALLAAIRKALGETA